MSDNYAEQLRITLHKDLSAWVPGLTPASIIVDTLFSGDYLVIVETDKWSFREYFSSDEILQPGGPDYRSKVQALAVRIAAQKP